MPITNRFSTTTNGALAITGNTLGLSKISNLNRAGTIGAIGAFVTTNTALQVPTFPAGTTLNYTQNSSTALLNIPAGSTILYAELVWGGNYLSRDQNITSVLGNPVSFTTPVSTYSITPSAVTAFKSNIRFWICHIWILYTISGCNVTRSSCWIWLLYNRFCSWTCRSFRRF